MSTLVAVLVVGLVVLLLFVGGVALALTVATARAGARRAPPRSPEPPYPFDYMDKAALAVTSRERGTSGTPTWDLGVRGALDPDHVKRALADVAARYPSIATKVEAIDGAPPRATKYRYVRDPAFSVERIFDVADARDPARLEAIARERRNRHTDLFAGPPVTLTLAVTGDDSCRLLFRQHHALADGRAFIAMLVDFAAFLNDARAGRRPSPEALAPIGRRGDAEALGLTPRQEVDSTRAGLRWLAGQMVRAAVTPLTPLQQNRSNDYVGENGTVHWVLGDDALGPWNAARKRHGVSLNTLLTGALFLANQRVHRARGLPLGRTNAQLLMETRPRDGAFISFANHLTFLDAEADLGRDLDPASLFASIQAQVVHQRDRAIPQKRLLGERWFVGVAPLATVQKMIFDTSRPTYNVNFSNLIPLEFPLLAGPGWEAFDLRVTTPVAPRHGIVVTVLRYGGKLFFNFNYKASAAPRDLAEDLARAFEAILADLARP